MPSFARLPHSVMQTEWKIMSLPTARLWQAKIQQLTHWTVIVAAFILPLSTKLTDLFFSLSALFSLFGDNLRNRWERLLHHPIAVTLVGFFLLYVIGATYTIAPLPEVLHRLKKIAYFLLAALLIPVLSDKKKCRYAIHAFLIASVIVLLLSYLKYFFMPDLFHTRFNETSIFKDHIIQNFLMAFATFILIGRWLHRDPHRWIYAVLIPLMIYDVLFISTGRTGYFIFGALLLYTLTHFFGWKGLSMGLVSGVVLFGLAYAVSPSFKARTQEIVTNVAQYQAGHRYSSVGVRIQSIQNAASLFQKHPWLGYGTGSFSTAYATLKPRDTQATGIMQVSYNSYLDVGVELGSVGISLLLLLFFMQWRYSAQLASDGCFVLRALLISIMVGCLANPWLSDTTELHLYTLFLAIGFSALSSYVPFSSSESGSASSKEWDRRSHLSSNRAGNPVRNVIP